MLTWLFKTAVSLQQKETTELVLLRLQMGKSQVTEKERIKQIELFNAKDPSVVYEHSGVHSSVQIESKTLNVKES